MKHFLYTLVLLFLLGCSSESQDSLEFNDTVKSIFSTPEIEDLNKILTFFESEIFEKAETDCSSISTCYQPFFDKMKSNEEAGEFNIEISFEKQQKLYQSIDSSTFNQIWSFSWGTVRNGDSRDTLKMMLWNNEGKYFEFLEKFAKEEVVVQNYYETYTKAGTISPSMVAGLIMYHDKYDIKDIRFRLLIAIHYLTLNDERKRKEKVE